MSDMIRPQPGIMDIDLYQGGQSHVPGVSNIVKLSSNENPFGASDKAREAYLRSVHSLHRYPNTDHASLRAAIAEVHGLDASRIICGVGSDEIITFLCQAYAGPGDEVLHTEHGFLMYRISALAAGATPVSAPERERTTDVDALLAACTDRTKLVFLANPNNPTGTMIGQGEIARLAAGLPPQALLVLDGAYAEYVAGFDGGATLVDQRSNVFMTRTFSKIYGLGGLRIGWGYGSKAVIDVLNRVRGPFKLSTAALEAAEAHKEADAIMQPPDKPPLYGAHPACEKKPCPAGCGNALTGLQCVRARARLCRCCCPLSFARARVPLAVPLIIGHRPIGPLPHP